MTPYELDVLLNGLFIYELEDGRQIISTSYKLREYEGFLYRGRTGNVGHVIADFAKHFAEAA